MLPPTPPFSPAGSRHPPAQRHLGPRGMFGEGAGGGRALPALLLGDPRASPSPSCTCTLPMRPSMCSEGPWPGCFSRSVSVLGRGRGTSGDALLPASSLPAPTSPLPVVPRHVQQGQAAGHAPGSFQSGEDPEEGMREGCWCCCGEEAGQVASGACAAICDTLLVSDSIKH